LRLIIASATLDAESFFNFFDSRQTPPSPICHLLTWESLAGQALCDE
jgi:HrpA-like RNA helicase